MNHDDRSPLPLMHAGEIPHVDDLDIDSAGLQVLNDAFDESILEWATLRRDEYTLLQLRVSHLKRTGALHRMVTCAPDQKTEHEQQGCSGRDNDDSALAHLLSAGAVMGYLAF